MLSKFIKLLAIVCLLPLSVANAAPNTTVAFLSPASESNPFFSQSIKIMQAAASNLKLDLEIHYGNDDLFVIREQAQKLFTRVNPPDYLVLGNRRGATAKIMREADRLGIYTVLTNGSFSDEIFNEYRHGPNALKNWIGQILPNNEQAGRLVAQQLVEQARDANKFDSDGKIRIVGISGAKRSVTTAQRNAGLYSYVHAQDDVLLQQIINVNWNQAEAYSKSMNMLKRYQDTTVVWTAGAYLAMGAAQAITASGLRPGQDVFTAGVDCLSAVFDPIKAGTVAGCAGGHTFDAAWAMVIISDHLTDSTEQFVNEHTQFYWSNKSNQSTMRSLAEPAYWDTIDFQAFCKTKKSDGSYDFNPKQFVETN